ncbi:MAG TPA: fatty acid metabolism transcriptional regulator FadR [Thermoflexia bacterium]|nr:fatty acid metabolism transcriptional regulator FadR [Thermoflexia bacterium]
MPDWTAPQRPADHAEETLVAAIMDDTYPPGTQLPGERALAAQLGVTRPTLREALQRLERDGWLTIHQGKPTVINDFWREGGLNVLSTIVRYDQQLPPGFVTHLLEVRLLMAPDYARAAVEHDPANVQAHLAQYPNLEETATAYTAFDWDLHYILTIASGNPIHPLILNGFATLYEQVGSRYFTLAAARAASRDFYRALLEACEQRDASAAERITREVMANSIELWQR